MRHIFKVCVLAFVVLVSACMPVRGAQPGYHGPQYGGYGPDDSGSYVAPAPQDREGYLCAVHRYCPTMLYYTDSNPKTERRLAKLEGQVEEQGRQILALAENDKELEEGLRLVVGYMRKTRQTLDQVVEQNSLACERFLKNPKVIKDKALRAKQTKFCEALEVAATENGLAPAKEEETEETAVAPVSEPDLE